MGILLIVVCFVGLDRWFYESFSLWYNTPDPLDRDLYNITKPFWIVIRLAAHVTGIGAVYFLIFFIKERGFRLANAFGATILIVAATVAVAQVSIGRSRPNRAESPLAFQHPLGFSLDVQGVCFPSGEAAVAFTMSFLLAGRLFPRRRYVWHALAVLVACARLLPGAHYPSDVLASWLLASIVAVPLFDRLLKLQDQLIASDAGS